MQNQNHARPSSQHQGGRLSELGGKYLSFTLKGEDYVISILQVREIIGMMPITSVPQTPEYLKGVINLRGKVIPVIDLRLRFSMGQNEYSDRTCIIVVEVKGYSGVLPPVKNGPT